MRRADWFPRTLFGRTLLFIAGLVVLGALTLAVIARSYAGLAAERAYDQLLSGAAIQLAENLYVQGGVLALNPPVAALASLSRYDVVYYKVVDSRGVVVAGYADLPEAGTLDAARHGTVFASGRYQRQPVRIATIARDMPEARVPGWARVTLAQTTHAREQLTDEMSFKVWTLIALMTALAIGASVLAIRRGLLPLAQIELLGGETDAARQRARLDMLRATCADVGRLTGQLLNHAMVIHRTEVVVLQPVDLIALARETLGRTIPLADERDVQIAFHSQLPEAIVAGDAISLQEALSNLLHNALHHAQATRLDVTIEAAAAVAGESGDITLSVLDDGPGIAPEHWDAVLRPFVRLDGGGAQRRDGSGLGLAIVKEVMDAHGARIAFAFPAQGGFAVRLTFARKGAR